MFSLTEAGRAATDPSVPGAAKAKARIDLAILNIEPFKVVFNKYSGGRLPQVPVMRDTAVESGVDTDDSAECIETFLANARFVGLIRKIAGTEHLVSVDDALDQLPVAEDERSQDSEGTDDQDKVVVTPRAKSKGVGGKAAGLDNVCFVISPIGDDDSEERKHADLVLGSLIEPALEELSLTAIRADKISKPGLITGQVLDHLTRARMVIADLSFGNPNVYYELALRQTLRKPLVQITRACW